MTTLADQGTKPVSQPWGIADMERLHTRMAVERQKQLVDVMREHGVVFPKGYVRTPENRDEALAMRAVAQQYLDEHP